jgi:ribosome-associated protein
MTDETNTVAQRAAGAGSRAGFKKIAIAAARLADAKKAETVAIYDMAGRSSLTDFVLAATADNPAHLEAIEEEISAKFKLEGLYPLYRDGTQSKNWKALDYGGLIVHIFERKARENFSFDKIYAGYEEVKWQERAVSGKDTGRRTQNTGRPKTAAGGRKTAPKKNKSAPKKAKAASKKAKKAPVKKTAARKKPLKKKK